MAFIKHNKIKQQLSILIQSAIESIYNEKIDPDEIYAQISVPPKEDSGEYCFACFRLTKKLGQKPNEIASKLCESMSDDSIETASAMGPYINIKFKLDAVTKSFLPQLITKEFFNTQLTQNAPKTMIEFSQPNTHKEMHVGHMRNLCLGDAVVKLHKYAGFDTHGTTFPGDVGTHVAKCLWYYRHKNTEPLDEKNKGAWLGRLYSSANNLLEDEKGTDKEETNRAELTAILKELEAGSGEYFDLWKETRQWSIDLMNDVYSWANVSFDSWYWESDVDSSSVDLIKEYYEKGLFIKDDGAIGIDLSEDKLGFCLLLKSDGTGLYATKDVELARRKFQDFNIEKSIYVVDNRQARHFKQVFKTLEKMGFDQAKDCYHLQYEMVELPDGAMSSRKGNIVPITSLINEMQSMIKEKYLSKYIGDWSEEEINHTSHIVAAGAIKYGMTRVDSNKKIVFDINEWLKLDGESGPYIQYVCARMNSLIKKSNVTDFPKEFLLSTKAEKKILFKLLGFNDVIENCIKQYKTHHLTGYLYDLAKMFNSYYAEEKIISDDQQLTQSRIALVKAVLNTLTQGLELLGIQTPEKM